MRRAVATAAAVGTALVLAAPGGSAGSGRTASTAGPTLKSLQAQINTLKKQVKKLQKDLKDTRTGVNVAIVYTACSNAVIADVLQGTWTQYLAKPDPGNANDYNACHDAFSVTRQPNTPTFAVLQQLIDLPLKP